MVLWSLGYPEAALSDSDQSLRDAREIGHAATLFFAFTGGWWTHMVCGNYAVASALADELVAFADEKGASFWKATGMLEQAGLFGLTGNPSRAVQTMPAGIGALRSTGMALHVPHWLSSLAKAYAEVGQFDDALRCIVEANAVGQATKEKWCDTQVQHVAGEIALMGPEPDAAKAEACFERALAVARAQQAKSWELRAAMSMARLWRDQGKRDEARDLLAPVYGWFTEGFDTLDLKEAKALLDGLAV
jgi:predicted ATPase